MYHHGLAALALAEAAPHIQHDFVLSSCDNLVEPSEVARIPGGDRPVVFVAWHSHAAYARILATTRLIHAGSVDPDLRVAAQARIPIFACQGAAARHRRRHCRPYHCCCHPHHCRLLD